MELKKWAKIAITLFSTLLFIYLIKQDVNLPMNAKIFYAFIICGSAETLAFMKY